MAVKYYVKADGFRDKRLTVSVDERLHEIVLYDSGSPASKGPKSGVFIVSNEAGEDVEFKCSFDADNRTPLVKAGGIPAELLTRLKWWQWVWTGAPVALIFFGGAIGGAIGGAAAYLNLRLMKSNMAAPLKYFMSAAVSTAAVIAWLVLAMLVQFIFDPQLRKSFGDIWPKGTAEASQSSAGSAEPPGTKEPRKNLYIDNGTGKTLSFSVDGKGRTPLEPHSFASLAVKDGKHKVEVFDGGALFDSASVEVPHGQAALFNPKSLSSYVLESASYSAVSHYGGGGAGRKPVENVQVVISDFGLLEALPNLVQVRVKASKIGESVSKTKLAKALPKEPSQELALKLLPGKAVPPRTAYEDTGEDSFDMALCEALGKEPKRKEHMDALLDKAMEEKRPRVLNAAFKSLKLYEAELPEDKLVALLTGEDSYHGGLRSEEPAAAGKVGWAAKELFAKGSQKTIAAQIPKLSDSARDKILRMAFDSSNDACKEIAAAAISAPQSVNSWRSLLNLVCKKEFVPDPQTASMIGECISKMPSESDRRHWGRYWSEKLLSLASSDNPQVGRELKSKIVEDMLKGDADIGLKCKMVGQLAAKGDFKTVAGHYEELPPAAKTSIMQNLPQRQNVKEISPDAIDLAWKLAAENEESIWPYAVAWLCRNCPDPIKVLEKAWEMEDVFQDMKRKRFDDALFSGMYSSFQSFEMEQLLWVAFNCPDERWAKCGVMSMGRSRDGYAEVYDRLSKAFKEAKKDENKLWALKFASQHLRVGSGRDKAADAFKRFISLAFSETSPGVRAAALEGAFEIRDASWPAEREVAGIIESESDPERKASLRKLIDERAVNICRSQVHDPKSRQAAISQLVGIASRSDDAKLAKTAVQALPRIEADEKSFQNLLSIAQASKFPECRLEALRKISYLGVDKQPEAFLRALDDKDAELRDYAFMQLFSRFARDKDGKWLQRFKAAASKETDQKLKTKMQNELQRLAK